MIFSLPGNEELARVLSKRLHLPIGKLEIRHFPDEETYLRIHSDVEGKEVIVVSTLDRPDRKMLPLLFLSDLLRKSGVGKIRLIAPYLAYMRQDRQFHPGEAVTSTSFASLVSAYFDSLLTIDPHLHRRSRLSEIYTIPAVTLHAAKTISEWVKKNVKDPLIIGPDEESEQWVAEAAKDIDAPYLVLKKIRRGDREVEISLPEHQTHRNRQPVIIDDIVSSATTMIQATKHIQEIGMRAPICIGVHAVFAGDSFEQLKQAGTKQIISCNTISHPSNGIDIFPLILDAIRQGIGENNESFNI